MQKLTLKRRASGIHAVHAPDGEPLGVVNPADLDLDDDELSELLKRHAEKRAATGAAHDFIKRVREQMGKTGMAFTDAMRFVAADDPELCSEYSSEVMGTNLF